MTWIPSPAGWYSLDAWLDGTKMRVVTSPIIAWNPDERGYAIIDDGEVITDADLRAADKHIRSRIVNGDPAADTREAFAEEAFDLLYAREDFREWLKRRTATEKARERLSPPQRLSDLEPDR